MPLITWNDKLSVKVKEIDDQHKRLIGIINHLSDGIQTGKGKQVLEETLSELVKNAEYHFQTEEKYMKQFGYPGYIPHRVAHDEFARKVLTHQADLKVDKFVEPLAIMAFLKVWVISHIMDMDQQYSETFIKGGLR